MRRPFRVLLAFLSCYAVCLLIACFMLRGCIRDSMNEHDRPQGHTAVTFEVSPRGDAIVFNATGEGGCDLYLMDLTTQRVTRVAKTPDYEVGAGFSPDGKWLVYAAGKPGDRADHIFLRSIDGQPVKQLTAGDANDESPTFSPDGSLIAFTRNKIYNWGGLAANWGSDGVLCVMKADGSNLREITGEEFLGWRPQFSRDGNTIYCASTDGMYAVPVDGSRPPGPLEHLRGKQVVYSPDGRLVTFSKGEYAGEHRIFVARADGTGLRQLSHPGMGLPDLREFPNFPGQGCFNPTFTPDGKWILFFLEYWPDGPSGVPKRGLWEVDLDGGNPREIAGYGLFDDPLNWRPKPPTATKAPVR